MPVIEWSGAIRVCGDYKLTVNRASHVETYPLPHVEGLLARLSGSKTATTLDMSQAYLKLLIEDESNKYLL